MSAPLSSSLAVAQRGDPSGFAATLRDHTATIHREAERAGFIADMIRGRATCLAYAIYLRNLLPVYEALEAELADGTGPAMAAFADKRLFRAAALRADLDALVDGSDALSAAPLPAALAYVAAIERAGANGTLVAHAYARYLGDLSGGQILAPLLARTLGLSATALTFYDFPAIPDKAAQKALMRDGLDAIAPESPAADAILGEAIAAFRHNIALSEAVQAVSVEPARADPTNGAPASL